MPLVIYQNVNDQTVTSRQHIARSLGGPVFNGVLFFFLKFFQKSAPDGSVTHTVLDTAVGMNAFLSTASLTPVPMLDGGPVLIWSLVEKGQTIPQADQTVKTVNLILGVGLSAASAVSLKKRRWLSGFLLAGFAFWAFALGLGWIKEQKE